MAVDSATRFRRREAVQSKEYLHQTLRACAVRLAYPSLIGIAKAGLDPGGMCLIRPPTESGKEQEGTKRLNLVPSLLLSVSVWRVSR